MTELETLHELKRTVEAAIRHCEIQKMVPIQPDPDVVDYRKLFPEFDFIVGNFGVKRIGGGVQVKDQFEFGTPVQSRQQGSR